jgi:hypothetical protein
MQQATDHAKKMPLLTEETEENIFKLSLSSSVCGSADKVEEQGRGAAV